jgi:methionyl-tRNA formyltransferase
VSRAPIKAVFFGTPEAAVPTLLALTKAADVVAVITRPDRPRGRSARPMPSPVKQRSAELGIPVLQPNDASALRDGLGSMGPLDIGVVTAYGSLISSEALNSTRRGFLNVHFSLLPRWRGASPVVAALLSGDEETGVTIMQLDPGLDTGPLVASRTVVIDRAETAGVLTARLASMGAELLVEHLTGWVDGTLSATPQPGLGVTYAPKLTKADRLLDPREPASALVRQIRALAPRPGAVLPLGDVRLTVLSGRSRDLDLPTGEVGFIDGQVLIGAGEGSLELLIVQPPGKQPMEAAAWIRGARLPTRRE